MKKLGIALGGGGSRCFAHLGMLEELQRNKIKIDYIVASSTGSLIAALVSNEVPIEKIKEEFYKTTTRFKWTVPNGATTLSQMAVKSILKNLLENRLIEKSAIPVTFTGTNMNNGNEVLLESGDIIKAVCASCAHPLVNRPIRYGRQFIADGGILDNIPSYICRQKVGKNVIVLTSSLGGTLDPEIGRLSKINIMFRAFYIPLIHFRKIMVNQYSDIIIEPLSDIKFNIKDWRKIMNFRDLDAMEDCYKRGLEETRRKIPVIKKMLR